MADAQMAVNKKYIYHVDTANLHSVNIPDLLRIYYTQRTHRNMNENIAGSSSPNHGIKPMPLKNHKTQPEIVDEIKHTINPNTLCYVTFNDTLLGIYLVTDIEVENKYLKLVYANLGFRTKRSQKSKSLMKKKRSHSKKAKLPTQKKKSRS